MKFFNWGLTWSVGDCIVVVLIGFSGFLGVWGPSVGSNSSKLFLRIDFGCGPSISTTMCVIGSCLTYETDFALAVASMYCWGICPFLWGPIVMSMPVSSLKSLKGLLPVGLNCSVCRS